MNTEFKDYPIEYKEVNPDDFICETDIVGSRTNNSTLKIEPNGQKIIIPPDENGYINNSLQAQITIDYKNTVIVNAAVGQGKSYGIIKTIKRYYEDTSRQKYLIIVASPFVSLVKQYVNDIHVDGGIPKEKIFDYNNLGRTSNIDYLNKFVHVVTANTLLGNPGEDGFKNSEIKREYLSLLSKYCEKNSIKVVFIYDEIHDSHHNFRQEYIFNLWKWQKVIHKNFIISATFNEASKVVVEYLAELTDRKIKIIESKRTRFSRKQSALYLHYSDDYNFTTETKEIKNTIFRLLERKKDIDVLCYSKSLSKDIINPREDIGKELRKMYGNDGIKDCTSQLASNSREENIEQQNQFDNSMCNVGTNFKTGVSIKKHNHALVIIMPSRSTRLHFKNQYGIFSGGINSVIQALARQRYMKPEEETQEKNQIHIILSRPNQFDYTSLQYTLMNQAQKLQFSKLYSRVHDVNEQEECVKYFKFGIQNRLLYQFYSVELQGYLSNEIDIVGTRNRRGLPALNFPEFKTFVLEKGEDYLANTYPIFGRDISGYITYAAITNQFINCKLEKVFASKMLWFSETNIEEELTRFYSNHAIEYKLRLHLDYGNFSAYYYELRDYVFNVCKVSYKRKRLNQEQETYQRSKEALKAFEIQLISRAKKWFFGAEHTEDYSRADYLLDNIKTASEIETPTAEDEVQQKRITLFKAIGHFRNKLLVNIKKYDSKGKQYYYLRTDNKFGLDSIDLDVLTQLEGLLTYDDFLNNDIFIFRRSLENKTPRQKINSLYKLLKKDFVVLGKRKEHYVSGERVLVKEVISIKIMNHNSINFLNPSINWEQIKQERIDYLGQEEYDRLYSELALDDIDTSGF
ncbi:MULTISPECIES: DEAD/DEAH box helicase family protein [Tenacibaculum]|uniref:Helicase/UvrB N-terminal domain-containing protein n=1 Tax=Tenacibaculum soleae TaxID=447689 RepID=A0A1B9Y2M1_9FLAO|nr:MULTISPECIES: DEAD/DEAH box helicase family protein [Tenacibaculum]MCT4699165.1 DEAD/DEAH box helicase family protein [Tenacibaculum haliotis]OCK44054.1 hypothetical protein BA195_05005 [Tenacibaculum soleae]